VVDPRPMAPEPVKPITVVLVQPPGDSLDLYNEYLRLQGIDCVAVTTVTDAVSAAPRADVVVTGIQLPGTADGIALIQQLRGQDSTRHLSIIVLTACVFETERQRANAAGCDAFLGKPCLPSDLHAEIRRVLNESKLRTLRGRPARITRAARPNRNEEPAGG
jgi:two-component system, cell cycle response regulator DivK